MLLQATDISRSFGSEVLFSGLSLTLHPGSSIAVVSPSGCGKSTLLSILGLLLDVSSGTLEFGGKDTASLDAGAKAKHRRLNVGFVFQHTQLLGSLRAIDNVTIGAALLHRSDSVAIAERFAGRMPDMRQRAEQLLDGFGLANKAYHYPHQLSVGQKRRVAVARALLLKPPLLIADEPTNDLDENSARLIADTLFAATTDEHALIYATHDKDFAKRADTMLDLSDWIAQ